MSVPFICQTSLDTQNHCPGTRGRCHQPETPGRRGEQNPLVLDPAEKKVPLQRELLWSVNASKAQKRIHFPRSLVCTDGLLKRNHSLKPEPLGSSVDTFNLPNAHFQRSKENHKATSLTPISLQPVRAVGKLFPPLFYENLSSHRKAQIIIES